MREIEAVVSGKVQAVNFRSFVKRKADNLWLVGEVENTLDFKVRVIAQGPAEKLEKFVEHLWKGPFGAQVSNVEIVWRDSAAELQGFRIKY